MAVLEEHNMETSGRSAQSSMLSKTYRTLCEAKREPAKHYEQMEGTLDRWGGVMDRGSKVG